jgi:hypothetical protein
MSGPVMKRIEALLRASDPMTVSELMRRTGCKHASVWYACKTHPLIYIDHWTMTEQGVPQWVAVYSIAEPPQDTPKPDGKARRPK